MMHGQKNIKICATHCTITVYTTVLLKMKPPGSKHVDGINNLKLND
jgi:hypothetical protein